MDEASVLILYITVWIVTFIQPRVCEGPTDVSVRNIWRVTQIPLGLKNKRPTWCHNLLTSSILNMFRTLIHPSSGACDFSIVSPYWLCVLVSMCVGVSVWLVGMVSVWQVEAQPSHIETPTHIETRTHNQCGDAIEKSQAPYDGCINVRNL